MFGGEAAFSVFLKIRTQKTFRILETIAKLFNLQLAGSNNGIADFKIISTDNFLAFQKFLLLMGELQFIRPKEKSLNIKSFQKSIELNLLNEVLKEELMFIPRKLGSRFGRKRLPLTYNRQRLQERKILPKRKKFIQIQFLFFKMGNNLVSAPFFFKNLEIFLNRQYLTKNFININLLLSQKSLIEIISSVNVLLAVLNLTCKLNANY